MNQPPTPVEQPSDEALKALFSQMRRTTQYLAKCRDMSIEERQAEIERIQDELGVLHALYTDDTPQFRALFLAWESIRLAWYVVGQGYDGGKLGNVEMALSWLKEALENGEP